jgi:hypothetical protein
MHLHQKGLKMNMESPIKFDPNKEIAITWHIDDVKGIRSDLTDEQAMDVLYEVKRKHDAEWGVSWTTLRTVAEILFPKISDD